MRQRRNPGKKKQWRDFLAKVIEFATAFYWLASSLLKLVELMEKLAG